MSIPDRIDIFGREYTVSYEKLDQDTYGTCCGIDAKIEINNECDFSTHRATFVHEAIHAILFESGLNKTLKGHLEEAICTALEHGLIRSGLIREF